MELIFYLFSFLMLYIIWTLFKDYLHPAFITVAVWFVIIFSYNYLIRKTGIWVSLSDGFYLVIIAYILSFCIFSGFYSSRKFCINTVEKVSFGLMQKSFLYASILFLFISNVYYINLIKQVGFSLLREETEFGSSLPIYVKLSSYFLQPGIIVFFLGITNPSNLKKYKIHLFVLAVMILISFFTSMNKGGFFQLAVCIFYFLKVSNKLNKKTFIALVLIFLGFVITLQFLRSGNETSKSNFFTRFLYVYFLSPAPAFDAVVTGSKNLYSEYFGCWTLSFFYRFFNKLGVCNVLPSTLLKSEKWIGVPYATNVYTMPGYFYIDFGIIGIIICAFLYGSIFGKLYSGIKYKNSIDKKIFYALYLYCLVFQFFGDWFFGFFSVTLQTLFWLFVLTHKFKSYALRFIYD